MRRLALAIVAVAFVAACGTEPPAGATNSTAQAQPAAQVQPVSRPAETAPAARPATEQTRLAQASPAGQATSTRFVAGQHYRVLNPAQPTNVAPGRVEVVDVFWYGCGGCYVMFPHMERWKASKPEAAEYVQLPAILNPGWQPHGRLFFATRALGIQEPTHDQVFREVHENRNPLDDLDTMIEFLGRFDVAAEDARAALRSFAVAAELRNADARVRSYRLTGVPAVVINGKYVTRVDAAGGFDALLDLINYLVELEAAALRD
jgi:thiol:disulfide interchange protein DsbA